MHSLDELLKESASIHGHLCAGQVLGVRMAMVGCREVGVDEPRGCKKLVVYVEIDRCATDAIQAVTGCSLGKRSLKFLDYGKMAATFVNTETQKSVRVLARDDARALAASYVNGAVNRHEAERQAYVVMSEESLFSLSEMEIEIPPSERPGSRGGRVMCEQCGEGINFKREVIKAGKILCIPCARGSYLPQNGDPESTAENPKLFFVVGYKKVGKTTLIEKLIPELAARGYRVGTVKHHHSEFPAETDSRGTDTWRHRQAGAKSVALVSPKKVAVFRETSEAASLKEVVANLKENDIILVEGFHLETGPKIEVLSSRNTRRLCTNEEDVVAVVRSFDSGPSLARFDPDSVKPLADAIEKKILRGSVAG
jgi:formylmethanofuran dehydrogenase subunit E